MWKQQDFSEITIAPSLAIDLTLRIPSISTLQLLQDRRSVTGQPTTRIYHIYRKLIGQNPSKLHSSSSKLAALQHQDLWQRCDTNIKTLGKILATMQSSSSKIRFRRRSRHSPMMAEGWSIFTASKKLWGSCSGAGWVKGSWLASTVCSRP